MLPRLISLCFTHFYDIDRREALALNFRTVITLHIALQTLTVNSASYIQPSSSLKAFYSISLSAGAHLQKWIVAGNELSFSATYKFLTTLNSYIVRSLPSFPLSRYPNLPFTGGLARNLYFSEFLIKNTYGSLRRVKWYLGTSFILLERLLSTRKVESEKCSA